jgi:hypothetical protein
VILMVLAVPKGIVPTARDLAQGAVRRLRGLQLPIASKADGGGRT